jgi:hypothetical protein
MPNFNHPDFNTFNENVAVIKTATGRKYLNGVAHVAVATSEKLASVTADQAAAIDRNGIAAVAGIAICRQKIASGEVDRVNAEGNVNTMKVAMRNDFLQLCGIPSIKG